MGLLDRQKAIAEANIRKSFSIGEGTETTPEAFLSKGGKRTGYFQDNAENRAKHRVGQKYKKEQMGSFADREKKPKGAIVYGKGGASKTSYPTVQMKSPHSDKMETMVKDGGEWKLKVGGELTKVSAARQAKAEEKHSGKDGKEKTSMQAHVKELQELKMLRSNSHTDLDRHKIDKRIKSVEAIIKHKKDFANAKGVAKINNADYGKIDVTMGEGIKALSRDVNRLILNESGSDSKKLGTAIARKLMEVGTNYAKAVKTATKNIIDGKYDGKEVVGGLNKVKDSLQKQNSNLDSGKEISNNKDKIKDMNNAAIAKIKSVVEVIEIARSKLHEDKKISAEVKLRDIAKYSGVNITATEKALEAFKLDIDKVHNHLVNGSAGNRMDFMTAISGDMNNAMQKKLIKKFGKTPAATLEGMKIIKKKNSDKKDSSTPNRKDMFKIKATQFGQGHDFYYYEKSKNQWYFNASGGELAELNNVGTLKDIHDHISNNKIDVNKVKKSIDENLSILGIIR